MNYREELDGLRALAVGLVMLAHAGFSSLKGGFIGVDIFFVLSGYLITTIIYREHIESEFSIIKFYERRIRRILPALFFILIVLIPVTSNFLLPSEKIDFSRGSISVLFFLSNIYYMFRGGYFRHELEENFLLHTWSLAVEEQFYIFFPLLVMTVFVMFSKRPKYYLVLILSICFFLSLGLAEWGWRSHPQASFYATPMRAWELLAGSLCALYLFRREKSGKNTYLSTVGMALVVISALTFSSKTPTPSLYTLIPILGSVLIILFGQRDKVTQIILRSRVMVGIGAISYSAYLWHQPIYALARITDNFSGLKILAAMLVTLALAWLTWRFVENPYRDRNRMSTKVVLITLSCAFAAILLSSSVTLYSKGFLNSYAKNDRTMISMNMIDFGNYVRARYNKFSLKSFSEADKSKLLIIGDSYAKDFLNTISESGNLDEFQISTFEMRPGCGNIFSERDFKHKLTYRIASICEVAGWYDDPVLLDRIAEADFIVLASNWALWESEYISESVDNIKDIASGHVYVLGKKNFGEINLRQYLNVEWSERADFTQNIDADTILINKAFEKALSSDNYLDLQTIVCESTETCRIFTDGNELMSLDGTHLTKHGAQFVGNEVFQKRDYFLQ